MMPVHLSLHDLSQLVILQTQSGRTQDEIVKVLVERGWPEVSAVRFVRTTLAEYKEEPRYDPSRANQLPRSERTDSTEQKVWWMIMAMILITVSIILCGLFLLAY